MSKVLKRINQLEKNIKLREENKFNLIPWYEHFPRLSEYVPGIFPGEMLKILAPTGVGKTKLAKFLSIFIPFELHKKYGLKFHVTYFALEESIDEFIDSLIIMMLYLKYNVSIGRMELNSFKKKPLSREMLEKIKNVSKYVEEIMQFIDVVDNIHNPTGAYKYLRNYSEKVGKHHYKQVEFYDDVKKRKYLQEVYSHYEQDDPETFELVVVDHVSLFSPEGGLDHHKSLGRWSVDYCRKQITKNWNWSIINVQQVAMSSDNNDAFKIGRLEPSISDLGNNKELARDDMLIISLFDPLRYDLKRHNGYDLREIGKAYRSLGILKNRYGESDKKIGLYFNGATGQFKELPRAV